MTLPDSTSPRASVVILAWKLVEQLRACISSVLSSEFDGLEVIVVVNGAAPDVVSVVDEFAGRVTKTELRENVGFGMGCDAGAAIAHGRYLVFLNDDAIASPDWLTRLVATAESTGAGAVGSLLLNPDGTVQEAGSALRPDAGTVQLGDGLTVEEAGDEGLLTRREVDYASGAALLVPADLFERLGGFDPAFFPAYYEDVDLCLRIRGAGRPVILEPEAVVTHARGASTSAARRFRDFVGQRSGDVFAERWRDTLAQLPAERDGAVVPAESDLSRLPLPGADPADPATTALRTQRAYATHLEQKLDEAEVRERAEVTRLTQELAAAQEEAARSGARAAELIHRLEDLESRGVVGIVKWRVGVAQQRRRNRG